MEGARCGIVGLSVQHVIVWRQRQGEDVARVAETRKASDRIQLGLPFHAVPQVHLREVPGALVELDLRSQQQLPRCDGEPRRELQPALFVLPLAHGRVARQLVVGALLILVVRVASSAWRRKHARFLAQLLAQLVTFVAFTVSGKVHPECRVWNLESLRTAWIASRIRDQVFRSVIVHNVHILLLEISHTATASPPGPRRWH
mmetsp:Transcript_85077/g.214455  ORF Transcript_85077/g.214455 Transcript_85077/m.214455 type:complete len:202 (+) Transcript_85077:627-1232(+)